MSIPDGSVVGGHSLVLMAPGLAGKNFQAL
jgi:hypothetical protein